MLESQSSIRQSGSCGLSGHTYTRVSTDSGSQRIFENKETKGARLGGRVAKSVEGLYMFCLTVSMGGYGSSSLDLGLSDLSFD